MDIVLCQLRWPENDKITAECKELIRVCLAPVIDRRLTLEEILAQPWMLKKYCYNYLFPVDKQFPHIQPIIKVASVPGNFRLNDSESIEKFQGQRLKPIAIFTRSAEAE